MRPILVELYTLSRATPSAELVELLQRAVGHVVKVLHHADDSSGAIGDLARELLELHAHACDGGAADPVKLAKWMIRFRFVDQDFFETDPVRYRAALGASGLAEFRRAVAASSDQDAFAARYARERLAVLDGDKQEIVRRLGGELDSPHKFVRVAEAMAELGNDDEVLAWAQRGITETRGWQLGALYDLACATQARRGEPLEVLRLRRAQHERMPSRSTYTALRSAAEALDAWAARARRRPRGTAVPRRRRACRCRARRRDHDLAWSTAVATPEGTGADNQWLRLAEARESDHPADALRVYQQVVDRVLVRPTALPTSRRCASSSRPPPQRSAPINSRHSPTNWRGSASSTGGARL